MTQDARRAYSLPLMRGSQYKLAFVIQLRHETNVEANRFAGRVEHVSSHEAKRFQSVDELLEFIAQMLTEVRNDEGPGSDRPIDC
jgi:hypothetical protein